MVSRSDELKAIEDEITALTRKIRSLRERGIRTPEMRHRPGFEVRRWLVDRGASHVEATASIVAVAKENRTGGDRT